MRPYYLLSLALLGSTCLSAPAFAVSPTTLPTGGTVVSGNASLHQNGAQLDVHQSTNRAIINWQGFDVGAGATVQFNQPTAKSVTLNRVTSGNASQIHGSVKANGNIYIVNPSGVLFGAGSQVNVGGLVASTHPISDTDFNNGTDRFVRQGASGSVENHGSIVADGGRVALIGATVNNTGTIQTPQGSTVLAAGDRVLLNVGAGGALQVEVDGATVNTAISNSGTINADGGQIVLRAEAANNTVSSVVSNSGEVRARTLANKQGRILLLADMDHGTVNVGGTLDASAPTAGNGGFIETSAAKVKIKPDAKITTKAANGQTGTYLIDPQDYIIAASGGDVTGAFLSGALGSTNVTIQSVDGAQAGNGDIFVHDTISWGADTVLTLNALRNIDIENNITATGTNAGLVLNHGAGAGYNLLNGAKITLSGAASTLSIGGQNYTLLRNANDVRNIDGGLGGRYAMAGDIDMASFANFAPIGYGSGSAFTGQFHGLGNTIDNLTVSIDDYNMAMFSRTNGATLRDFSMTNVLVDQGANVGAVAGRATNTTFKNISISGDISTPYWAVGGLVGEMTGGLVENVRVAANITGADDIGGLVGVIGNAIIRNAHVTGNVSGGRRVGGLAGDASGTDITGSSAGATVTATGANVGGLVGRYLNGTIRNSHATGNVRSNDASVGGIVGIITNGSVLNSYATGNVTAPGEVGGLIGRTSNTHVADSYATGNVTTRGYAGGLIGSTSGNGSYTLTNVYATGDIIFDGALSAYFDGYYGGLVGYNMNTDITNAHATGNVTGGGGSAGGLIGYNNNSDLASVYATGNVSTTDNGAGGLIGRNLNSLLSYAFASGNVVGADNVGGLLGYSAGNTDTRYAFATGSVTGNSWVGGLVGFGGGPLLQTYASGLVTGNSYVGGIAGANLNGATTAQSFWNVQTTGQAFASDGYTVAGATGLNTSPMQQMASYTGWDISDQSGSNAVWRIYEGQSTPWLRQFLTPLTITANDAAVTEGTAYTGGNGTRYDLASVDSGLLLGSLNYSGTSQGSSTPGTYDITPSGLHSGPAGYDITFASGALTINPTPPPTPPTPTPPAPTPPAPPSPTPGASTNLGDAITKSTQPYTNVSTTNNAVVKPMQSAASSPTKTADARGSSTSEADTSAPAENDKNSASGHNNTAQQQSRDYASGVLHTEDNFIPLTARRYQPPQ